MHRSIAIHIFGQHCNRVSNFGVLVRLGTELPPTLALADPCNARTWREQDYGRGYVPNPLESPQKSEISTTGEFRDTPAMLHALRPSLSLICEY